MSAANVAEPAGQFLVTEVSPSYWRVTFAAELYLSPRTVEWHLRNVFAKLGVTTRRELRRTSFAAGQKAASD